MLLAIIKDILSTKSVTDTLKKALAWIVLAVAVIVAVKFAWGYYDSRKLKEVIEEQRETIDKIVDQAKEEKDKADKDREIQEQAKNRLVEHVEKQAKDKQEFGEIDQGMKDALDRVKERQPDTQPVVVVVPVVKPVKSKVSKTPHSDPKASEGIKTYSADQERAAIAQTALLQAYRKAVAMSEAS